MNMPDPQFPYPAVHLNVTIDLESRRYDTGREVADHLRQQARHLPTGCTAEIRLGEQALLVRPTSLEREIAAACFLTAQHIDIKVPAGIPGVDWLRANVQRHVRELREDHARMLAGQRHTG